MTERLRLHIPPATTIDLERRQVARGGRVVRLTALETRLLAYLWRHRDRVVPTKELLVEVWGYAPETMTRAVDSAVRRLRHKLEPEPAAPVHLVGLYGQGYVLSGLHELPTPQRGTDGPRPSAEILDVSNLSDERDPLTGLFCRSALVDRMNNWLTQGNEDRVWVLVCALDRLSHINAASGLTAGDALLARAAHRIKLAAAPHEVGRFSGNAFAIYARGSHDVQAPRLVAERLLRELEPPFEVEGRWTHIGIDIGIAHGAAHCSAEEIIRRAALALQKAQSTGPGRVVLFDQNLAERTEDDADIEAALSQAIDQEQLALHYQPIFELETGRIRALEALLRWRRPGFGVVRPDRFIQIAEQSSLITRLQRWVIPRVLKELGQVVPGDPNLGPDIWINVSGCTLSRPDTASSIGAWLQRSGVPASRVTLELTETGLLQDEEAAVSTLSDLRNLGVHLAIDDFGTGYASLSHLVRFPVGVLKIDKSFVQPLGEIDERVSIAATIIEIGRHFNLEVVAEGVERTSQLAALRRLGCGLVQGHLLSPPGALEDLGDVVHGLMDQSLLPDQ